MSTTTPSRPHPFRALLERPWIEEHPASRGVVDRAHVAKGWIGVIALLLALYGFWRIRGGFLTFVNNSDILYPATFYWDMVGHKYPIHGWWLSPAPYFVPDLSLFLLAAAVTTHFAYAYLLYASIMLAGFLASFYWLAGWMNRRRADRMLMIGLTLLGVSAICGQPGAPFWRMVCWLLAPMGHGGGMLAGIVLLGLTLAMLQRVTAARAISFFAVAVIAVVSDRLTLTEILGPLCLVSLGFADWKRQRTPFGAAAIIVVSTGISAIASKAVINWTHRHGPFFIAIKEPEIGDRQAILATWAGFVQDWGRMVGRTSPLFILLVLSVLAAGTLTVARLVQAYRAKTARSEVPSIGVVLWVSILAWVLAIAVPVLTCVWENADCFRYAHALVVMPLLMLVMCGARGLGQLSGRAGAGVGAAAGLCILLFWGPVVRTPPVHLSKIFYGPNVQFVDRMVRKHGLHYGYSGYWASKPIFLFSKTGVMLNVMESVQPEPTPQLWINNPNHWCRLRGNSSLEYPIYDFVLCPSVDEAKVVNTFGFPALVEQGAGMRMLIYNRPSDVVFRNFGRVVACNAIGAGLPCQVTPRPLGLVKELYYPWDASGNVRLAPGKPLVVKISPPLAADVLEIMTHSVYSYDVEFRMGTESVGRFALPVKAYGGMQPYHVALGGVTAGKVFDSIVITPPSGPGDYSVGTVQVLRDGVLHPADATSPR